MSDATLLGIIGLISGILLGFAARFGRFCTLGALEDIVYGGRYYRSLMWVSAMGFLFLIMGLAIDLGYFELERAIYLQFQPNYGAHIVGGLLFGFGMALAGMCGFTALARVGTGDMRALIVVLFIGIFSYVASSGLFSSAREALFHYDTNPDRIPSFAGLIGHGSYLFYALGIAFVLLPLIRKNFRQWGYVFWSFIVALGIALGWIGTNWIAQSSFDPIVVESHTFSLPVGETLLYGMLSSGMKMSFGIGSVSGIVMGSIIASLIKREVHWEACDDARELRRHILGAMLMGLGAVIGFGCSVGQGLSAMGVLYFGAPVTLVSIIIGATIGLKYLIEG